MKDRFTRGFIAGVIAGIPVFVFNWASYSLDLSTLRYADFMGIFAYGRAPVNPGETAFAVITVYFFVGLMGALFALLILKIGSDNLFFKSIAFGVTIWFVTYAISMLFGVPELSFIPLKTAVSNFIGA